VEKPEFAVPGTARSQTLGRYRECGCAECKFGRAVLIHVPVWGSSGLKPAGGGRIARHDCSDCIFRTCISEPDGRRNAAWCGARRRRHWWKLGLRSDSTTVYELNRSGS